MTKSEVKTAVNGELKSKGFTNKVVKVTDEGANTVLNFEKPVDRDLQQCLQDRYLNGVTVKEFNKVYINTPNQQNKRINIFRLAKHNFQAMLTRQEEIDVPYVSKHTVEFHSAKLWKDCTYVGPHASMKVGNLARFTDDQYYFISPCVWAPSHEIDRTMYKAIPREYVDEVAGMLEVNLENGHYLFTRTL